MLNNEQIRISHKFKLQIINYESYYLEKGVYLHEVYISILPMGIDYMSITQEKEIRKRI